MTNKKPQSNTRRLIIGVGAIAIFTLVTVLVAMSPMVPASERYETRIPGTQLYKNEAFAFGLRYPADWRIEEHIGRQRSDLPEPGDASGREVQPEPSILHETEVIDPHLARFGVNLYAMDGNGSAGLLVFPRPPGETLEEWAAAFDPSLKGESTEQRGMSAVVEGQPAYAWRSYENGHFLSIHVVILGPDYLYAFDFPTSPTMKATIDSLINGFSIGGVGGSTTLPEGLFQIDDLTRASTLADGCEAAGASKKCPNCNNETDYYENSYTCCTTYGNCTWKAEQSRAGNDNFKFGGVAGRHAYKC